MTAAGGTPRLRASLVVVSEGHLLVVKLRDPATHVARWFVPGGMVEAGEDPIATAVRETREETGVEATARPSSRLVAHYPFTWGGRVFQCETHFFRGDLTGPRVPPPSPADAPYNEGAAWLPLAQLDAQLGFDAAIHAAVRRLAHLP